MATSEQIAVANATSRARGAVGKNAIVPRLVRELIPKDRIIMDFGAGSEAVHARSLRADGWQGVDAYEFGANRNSHHITDDDAARVDHMYDCVYASNVLNVQSDRDMMRETVEQVAYFMHWGGMFIANYPASPRKSDLSPAEVADVLREFFQCVTRCRDTTTPVFICEGLIT